MPDDDLTEALNMFRPDIVNAVHRSLSSFGNIRAQEPAFRINLLMAVLGGIDAVTPIRK